MATIFEPSASLRAPYSTAAAPSMADTLPNINFGFDELRDRMAKFTYKFDEFIAEGRKRVLEERNSFRMNIAELEEDQKLKLRALDILTSKSLTHTHTLEKESAELSEIQSSISSITSTLTSTRSSNSLLTSRISSLQSSIQSRLSSQQTYSSHLSLQSQQNSPELDFWTNYLCLTIESANQIDRLRFIYTHIDDQNWDRTFEFELSMESRDYSITKCEPKIEKGRLEDCVERLNESRDLAGFLKGMRVLFSETL